ncbi:MAG: hypothetical protein ACI9NC_005767, partial [Verrucomicrobiales bacterium]
RDQANYLHALGLDQRIFTTPPGKLHSKSMA